MILQTVTVQNMLRISKQKHFGNKQNVKNLSENDPDIFERKLAFTKGENIVINDYLVLRFNHQYFQSNSIRSDFRKFLLTYPTPPH